MLFVTRLLFLSSLVAVCCNAFVVPKAPAPSLTRRMVASEDKVGWPG
jgi:hypothetical protein